ncbi:MAG: FAD-dependent monooxygenase [Halobacteriota archaeon]
MRTTSTSTTDDAPVLVAGAGPVGMIGALALHARGVPVRILEAEPKDRRRPGSRAIYLHEDTLEVMERAHPGLGEAVADNGIVWATRRTLYGGTEVFSRTYTTPGGRGRFPHFTSIPQSRTEELLLAAVREADVEIEWDTAVESVDTTADGVTVTTSTGDVREAPYLLGADGASSTVRTAIGAEFEGDQSENSFVIADVEEHPDNPRPQERIFHYDHPEVGGRNVLIVPFQGGWRIDVQCKPSDDPDRLSEAAVIGEIVARVLGERYRDRVEWVSDYKFLQVISDTYIDEHRRVMLAGEAAHLFAPFGARGLNSGAQDAEMAARAIAIALGATTDRVAIGEVERFDEIRRQAGQYNKTAAGEALEYLQGDSLRTKTKKRVAAGLANFWEPAGEWLDDAPYGPHEGPPTTIGQY